jgi:uncharacterized membrane protein
MRKAATWLVIILLAQQSTIFAQKTSDSSIGTWSAIQALNVGNELNIKLKDGRSLKGILSGVSDSGVTVSGEKGDTVLERETIFRIYRQVSKSHDRAIAIGAAIGGGLGVAGGASSGGAGDLSQPASIVLAAAVYGGIGALIGRAVSSGKKRVLIYQAKK